MAASEHIMQEAWSQTVNRPESSRGAYESALDPSIAQAHIGLPDKSTMDISRITELREAYRVQLPSPCADIERSDHVIRASPNVTLEVMVSRPTTNDCAPCVFWIHGGGYVTGSFRTDHERMDGWVKRLKCAVVSVDYRLAPEFKYPAALDDCFVGLEWTIEHAAHFNIDRSRIIIAGASAGGGLAASLAVLARDRSVPGICGQLLLYPMLDDRFARYPSSSIDSPRWGRQANLVGWSAYLGVLPGGDNIPELAAAGRVRNLSGVSPAFVAVAALDVLRDEALLFGARLLAADVETELHVYPRAPHGFEKHAPNAVVSARLRRDVDDYLYRMFARQVRNG